MSFFDEPSENSVVKSTIVSKYFAVWCKVIIATLKRFPQNDQRIAYVDLFAGPGRYDNGTISTPVKILSYAISDDELRKRLVTVFNDKDSNYTQNLEEIIGSLEGVDSLDNAPDVWNEEVGDKIIEEFEGINMIPTFCFVDPWGYKGLSLRLVNSVVKDWGCDAVLFFNYNRVNMGVSNDSVKDHMTSLFGEERYKSLRHKLVGQNSIKREYIIVEELCQALKSYGTKYVLPFRFKSSSGSRTSHHLIFVSKHIKGYEIMKEIMAKESSSDLQGVPSFEYNPSDNLPRQSLLFSLSKPLDELESQLLEQFAGRTILMKNIYKEHHVDTRYIKKNYKVVLRKLYDEDKIEAVRKNGKPPHGSTFSDELIVTFK